MAIVIPALRFLDLGPPDRSNTARTGRHALRGARNTRPRGVDGGGRYRARCDGVDASAPRLDELRTERVVDRRLGAAGGRGVPDHTHEDTAARACRAPP